MSPRRRFPAPTRRIGFLIAVLLPAALGHDGRAAIAEAAAATERSSSTPSTSTPPDPDLSLPLVVHTWPWTQAAAAGYAVFAKALEEEGARRTHTRSSSLSLEEDEARRTRPRSSSLSLDAAVAAASRAERDRCDGTVGPGGNSDELGRVTLDAVVMDGATMRAGGVGAVEVAEAVETARLVMETTRHSLLVGTQATAFAESVGGFTRPGQRGLRSDRSVEAWEEWRRRDCQPNFRREGEGSSTPLSPDPRTSCGPYRRRRRRESEGGGEEGEPLPPPRPSASSHDTIAVDAGEEEESPPSSPSPPPRPSLLSHDTIAVVAVDADGNAAAAASSNGAAHKVPGRAGDAAVPGGGAYSTPAGGCGSTGDGDAHLRYYPCVRAMASLEADASRGPRRAAEDAIRFIAEREPGYVGALVVACARTGRVGAAAYGWNFSYTVARRGVDGGRPVVHLVEPIALVKKDGGDVDVERR